jgi:hypothetical protein
LKTDNGQPTNDRFSIVSCRFCIGFAVLCGHAPGPPRANGKWQTDNREPVNEITVIGFPLSVVGFALPVVRSTLAGVAP